MADIERAKRALVNAHNAGDVAAAKQLANYIKSQQTAGMESFGPAKPPPPKGFMQRVGEDYQRRIGEMEQSAQAFVAGQQSYPETAFQFGGQALNFGLNDVVGQGIASGLQALPAPVKEAAKNVYTAAENTPVLGSAMRGAGMVLGEAAEGYNKFKQDFPRAGRNLDAALGYGSALAATLPVKGETIPSQVVGAGQTAVKATGKTAAQAARKVGGAVDELATAAQIKTFAPDISADTIRAMGGKMIGAAESSGAVIRPEAAANFIDRVSQTIKPKSIWAKAAVVRDQADDIIDSLAQLKGQPMGLDAAMELESTLGKLAYSPKNYQMGKFTPEGLKIKKIQEGLAEMVDNAAEAGLLDGDPNAIAKWREGQKYWAASVRARELENIIENAANFDQPATAIRVGMRNIIKNKSKFNKYTKDQQKLIREAANTGIITDLARLGASGLGPIGAALAGGGAGFVAGGPIGAAVGTAVAGGTSFAGREASKAIATSRQMAKAQKAYKAVAAESVGLPTKRLTMNQIMQLPIEQRRLYLKD